MWDNLELDYEYTAELKEIITSVLKPIEQERFIILFSKLDGNNQYALFNRFSDFYKKPTIKDYFWLIYDNEPREYIEISREILSLFDGNLFYVQEGTLTPYPYYANLFGIDSQGEK